MNKISIETEYIKLDSFLKFSGAAADGAEAKRLVAEEKVLVNGEICTQRGKKLRAGDRIELEGESYEVISD